MERPIDKGNNDYEERMDYIKELEKYCDYLESYNLEQTQDINRLLQLVLNEYKTSDIL